MAYISNADMVERMGASTVVQLADDNGDGTADTGVLDEARLSAEAEVNSCLARRYQTPIDLVVHPELADMLAGITLDLVENRLRSRRPPVSEDVVRRAESTRLWLERLADGTVELPSVASVASGSTRGVVAQSLGEERTLSREELADF